MACQKGKIVYLAAATKESIPQMLSGNVETFKKDKMRTAKNIMDKIAWNDNLDKEDFRVGYLDKYEGVLELPFGEIQAAEIKDYRIEYFKRAGVVVWSKKERIDTL